VGWAVLLAAAAVTLALTAGLIAVICYRGLPYLSWDFLTGEESILHGTVGILPALENTLFVVAAALVIALPLGVGAAVYLTEYAKPGPLVSLIELAVETLAGIPSILYALVGVIVFCTALGLQKTLLSGALTLSMMVLPVIIRTTQESLKTVPVSYREGALGLGSGQWHMVRTVVLPAAWDGIATGCILSIGRIVGESAVVIYTAGLSTRAQDFAQFWRASGATLSAALYLYAKERADLDTAFAVAVVLLAVTVALNLLAGLRRREK
jgi:phosphate transport system permease protein